MSPRHYRIVALPGEGAGSEITQACLTILQALAAAETFTVDVEYGAIGEPAQRLFGTALPDDTLQLCENANGVVFGATDPEGLQALRQHFDLFISLRAVRPSPSLLDAAPVKPERLQDVELLFVRGLTSGSSVDAAGRGVDGRGAYGFHTIRYDDADIRRLARMALELAQSRRQRLAVAHKEDVLPYLPWTRLIQLEAEAFPTVTVEPMLVDRLAMRLAVRPQEFDVVLTCNLLGDLLSNLTGAIIGASELLGSASLNSDRFGLYEAVYSPSDALGQDRVNPLGALSSIALMLEQWGEQRAAQRLSSIQEALLAQGYRTANLQTVQSLPQARPAETPSTEIPSTEASPPQAAQPHKLVSLDELVALFVQAIRTP